MFYLRVKNIVRNKINKEVNKNKFNIVIISWENYYRVLKVQIISSFWNQSNSFSQDKRLYD